MKKIVMSGITVAMLLAIGTGTQANEHEKTTSMIIVKEGEPAVAQKNAIQFDTLDIEVLELTESQIEEYKKEENVRVVEEDVETFTLAQTTTYGYKAVKGGTFASYGLTGKGVKVAVIDSGIAKHEDLRVAGGKNFIDKQASYMDDNGHGTHVAGIIAALDNNVGVVGMAPDVELFALKVLGADGMGRTSHIVEAINWSIENKMDIINISIGIDTDVWAVKEAVRLAYNAGIIVIAAAGNNASAVIAPAKYEGAIAVSATNQEIQFESLYSNFGPEIAYTAPGTGITSTYLNNGYEPMEGTSMASPFVAGYFALLKQKNPHHTIEELKQIATNDALDLGTKGRDHYYGHGLIQEKMSGTEFTLTKKTGLYQISNGTTPLGHLEPQTVNVKEYGEHGWLKISQEGQDYWVKDGYTEERLYISKQSGMYKQNDGSEKLGEIHPQYVIVKEYGGNGWMKIRSYKGDVWIKEGYTKERVYFTDVSGLYKEPNGLTKIGTVSPQWIDVLENRQGWYKINSYAGIAWIKNGYNHTRVYIGKTSGLYNTPENAEKITVIAPQYVIQLSQNSDGWRLIQTYLGNKWVKEGTMDVQVRLTKNSGIYDRMNGNRLGTLAPQSIKGISYHGNGWYKINSYKGIVYTKNGQ